ncbi:MAG: hypothetical protein O3C40_25715 [Planctomycetota bacterium]|nr:hypothetical protein [Planctomycetota bacterium]
MNELLQDVLHGPIGWQIMWSVLACIGILLAVAVLDGLASPNATKRRRQTDHSGCQWRNPSRKVTQRKADQRPPK